MHSQKVCNLALVEVISENSTAGIVTEGDVIEGT